jgi:peptide/nickel transport system substrate-binding protein
MGTSNVCGAGWVVPAKYYQKIGKDGFLQKPIGAGPYKLVSQQAGTKIEYEAFEGYYPGEDHLDDDRRVEHDDEVDAKARIETSSAETGSSRTMRRVSGSRSFS